MTQTNGPLGAQAHIKFDPDGKPFVEAYRCLACKATTADPRLACPACGAREKMESVRTGATGTLRAFSIVKRSYPGIPTPFVSAVVDMDDGPTLKANLVGAGFEPEAILPRMKVRLQFNDALGRKDKEGRSYVGYQFEPVKG